MENSGNLPERGADANTEHDLVPFIELDQNVSNEREGGFLEKEP